MFPYDVEAQREDREREWEEANRNLKRSLKYVRCDICLESAPRSKMHYIAGKRICEYCHRHSEPKRCPDCQKAIYTSLEKCGCGATLRAIGDEVDHAMSQLRG